MSVPGRFKHKLQNRIAWILLAMFTTYAWIFLPTPLFAELTDAFGGWAESLTRLGVAAAAVIPVRWILFSQDGLANGNSRWSKFFRNQYPHSLLIEKYGCSKKEATTLWFQWFNMWENGPNEFRAYHQITFGRSYGCRFIYYLKKWLIVFAATGTVTLLVNWFLELEFSRWVPAMICIAGSLSLFLTLSLSNRIPTKEGKEPTGCWNKFKEISDIQKVLLQKEILDNAATFDDAWQRVVNWVSEKARTGDI